LERVGDLGAGRGAEGWIRLDGHPEVGERNHADAGARREPEQVVGEGAGGGAERAEFLEHAAGDVREDDDVELARSRDPVDGERLG
jgi:hypothetical protein